MSTPTANVPPDVLHVLTWNVHGLPLHSTPARLQRLAAWVGERAPDLVLFQEVWSRGYARMLTAPLASLYEARFVAHPVSRRPRGGLLTLVRRDVGLSPGPPLFEPFGASASWFLLYEGDGVAGKGALAVQVRRGALSLAVVNTHLQAQYLERTYTDVRRDQLTQLAAFADRFAAGGALLLGGDLNTEAGEDLYRTHLGAFGDDLTAAERRARGGTTCFDRKGGRSEWIDYVFSRGLECGATLERIENTAPDHPYSDHDGLLLRIELTGAGTGATGGGSGAIAP